MKYALQTNLNFIRIDELILDQGGAIMNENNPESNLGSKYMIGSTILSLEMRKVIPTLTLISKGIGHIHKSCATNILKLISL